MRVLLVVIGLLISGCATDVGRTMSGDQTKNGGPIRLERLGTVTSVDITTGPRCRPSQVNWCTLRGGKENCQCLHIRAAEEKVRRMVGQARGPQY